MRAHDVTSFPDPEPGGGFPRTGLDRTSPRFVAAQKACAALLPGLVKTPAQIQEHRIQMLAFAACMRAHGLPWFPDPDSHGGFTVQPGSVAAAHWDPASPQFQAAQNHCSRHEPGNR
jgi:hypothetical protein